MKKTKKIICGNCQNRDMHLFLTKKNQVIAQCKECLQENIVSITEPEKEKPKKGDSYIIMLPKDSPENIQISNYIDSGRWSGKVKDIKSK